MNTDLLMGLIAHKMLEDITRASEGAKPNYIAQRQEYVLLYIFVFSKCNKQDYYTCFCHQKCFRNTTVRYDYIEFYLSLQTPR